MAMKAQIMMVPPVLAAEWLKKNVKNRAKRPAAMAKYVRCMNKGEWMLTHQGIAFDEDGVLLDGQHRLEAIVKTGVTVEMLVCFGVSRAAYAYLDGGATRNAADRLEKNAKHAEVISLAARLMAGTQPTTGELIDMDALIGDKVALLMGHCNSSAVYFSSASMKLAAVAHLLNGADQQFILDTYRSLVLSDIPKLQPSGVALTQQVLRSQVSAANSYDTLARGVAVFDPKRKNITKITVKDATVSVAWVRRILQGEEGVAAAEAEQEELMAA